MSMIADLMACINAIFGMFVLEENLSTALRQLFSHPRKNDTRCIPSLSIPGIHVQDSIDLPALHQTPNASQSNRPPRPYSSSYHLSSLKKRRLHIYLAQLRHTPQQLHQRLHALQHPHMTKPNLPNKLQPRVLTQPRHCLRDPKHRTHNIMAAIPQPPKLLHALDRTIHLAVPARLDDRLHLDRMRRVHHLEHVLPTHEAEPGGGGLQIVDCLPHIALGAEHQRRDPVVRVLHLLRLADLQQPRDDLLVRQARVPQDGTARLQRLDDLVTLVAREREPRRGAVDFHRAPKRLLGPARHAVCFVQDDEFLAARGQGDFFLGEGFDAVADDVDAPLVAGVELQDGFFVGRAEELPCEAEDGGCFADAGHAADDYVRHVAVFGDDFETLDCFGVADYVGEVDGAVLFDPRGIGISSGVEGRGGRADHGRS